VDVADGKYFHGFSLGKVRKRDIGMWAASLFENAALKFQEKLCQYFILANNSAVYHTSFNSGKTFMYIDSHAHFDMVLEEDPVAEDEMIGAMNASGVVQAVQVAIDVESSQWSYGFAKRHAGDGILFTVGIHPSSRAAAGELGALRDLLEQIRAGDGAGLVFGVGECGLDFYRMRQDKGMQIESFRFQIECANRFGLPVIVHSRDAMDETLEILREMRPAAAIMHCFPGGRREAQQALDLGFHLSFAGNLTYKSAVSIQESARYAPLDRILLETDAPFLAPVPLRGKKNRPEYVAHTYRYIAALRSEPPERIVDAVHDNFMELRSHAARTA
jgi:TatD DNase family protein